MRKKALFLAAVLILSIMSMLMPASAVTANGICGVNKETYKTDGSVTWEYDAATETLSFKGNGHMNDYRKP